MTKSKGIRKGFYNIDESNGSWKSDGNISNIAIHEYIRRRKHKPLLCEHCKKNKARELANLKNHQYTRNQNDYAWLCHICHQKLDKTTPPEVYDWKGKHHTEETKQKIRENKPNQSGKNNPFYGRHHTEETKQKNREAHIGKNPNKGYHHTEESKRKMSEAHQGMIPWNKGKHGIYSEGYRKKIGDAHKGRIPWNKGKCGYHLSGEKSD